MRFRLTYRGNLLSSKPPQNPGDPDKRAWHKHAIRREFHKQLKALWQTTKFLTVRKMDSASAPILPPRAAQYWAAHPNPSGERFPMADVLGEVFGHSGYKYVPLIWEEIAVSCSLRILLLRRNTADAVVVSRDIDNRIKTVIDALTMPSFQQGSPVDQTGAVLPPQNDEEPFYVLMDDDKHVTHLEVEADNLLAVPPGADESYVELVIMVEIRPYNVTMWNLAYG